MPTTHPHPVVLAPVVAALVLLFAPAQLSRAANFYWDAASGTWFTSGGWHSGARTGPSANAPGTNDQAMIASGTVTIGAGVSATNSYMNLGHNDTGAAATLIIEDGGYYRANTAFSLGLYDTTNTANPAGNGILDLRAGGTLSIGANFQVAYRNYGQSTVTIAGTGTFGGGFSIANGIGASGTVNILSGGVLLGGTGDLLMANNAGGNALLDIKTGGTLSIKGRTYIGDDGTGTLNLAGVFTTGSVAYVGMNDSSTGTLKVLAGGTLVLGNNIVVGTSGAGVLTVAEGGSIVTANATGKNIYLGDNLGSSGTAVINGYVNNALGFIIIGQRSIGHLHIGQTGTLLSGYVNFAATAATPAATGTAIVEGYWRTGGVGRLRLAAAATPAAYLEVTPTGTLIAMIETQPGDNNIIGYEINSSATAQIDGYMLSSGGFFVGGGGTGVLNIGSTGTLVTTSTGYLINNIAHTNYWSGGTTGATILGDGARNDTTGTAAAHGTANVAGLWSHTGQFVVGYWGQGILNVANGGTLAISGSLIAGVKAGSSGTLNIGGHWDITDTVQIGDAGEAQLNLLTGGTVSVKSGGTLAVNKGTPGIGADAGAAPAALEIESGAVLVSSRTVYIARAAGGTATLNVRAGGTYANTSTLVVGERGEGSFLLEDGAVASSGNIYAGDQAGSHGRITLSGSMRAGAVTLGQRSPSDFLVTPTGVLASNGNVILGNNPMSSGALTTATVAGAWSATGQLTVGNSAPALLHVLAGGTYASTSHFNLSNQPGAVSSATIAGVYLGQGDAADFTIGYKDAGALTVVAGGTLKSNSISSRKVYVGRDTTATAYSATLAVAGYYSATGPGHNIGNAAGADGCLIVADGGTALAGSIEAGTGTGAFGFVSVGNNAYLETARDTNIGFSGNGALAIAETGTVITKGAASIGRGYTAGVGSVSSATIAGRWQITGVLQVAEGNGSEAVLDILPTGTVSSSYIRIGGLAAQNGRPASTGTINLAPGGHLSVNTDLYVGTYGNGVLNVAQGARVVTGEQLFAGYGAAATGTINLAGSYTSTQPASGTSLVIGNSGTGLLNLRPGAVLETTALDFVGHTAAAAHGTVTIENGAVWRKNVSNNLWVGGSLGSGAIYVRPGGLLDTGLNAAGTGNMTTYLGVFGAASSGTIVVENGGLWKAGNVTLGYQGTGVIIIEEGGTMSMMPRPNAADTGTVANNTIYVTNNSAGLTSTGSLVVRGLLEINNYYIPVNYGTGVIYIAHTGTLKNGTGGIDLGQYAGAHGELHVDGFWEGRGTFRPADGNGLAATAAPVTGIVTVGVTGTILTGPTYISDGPVATGTMTMDGYWHAAGEVRIGSAPDSKATLIIGETGVIEATGNAQTGHGARSTGALVINGKWQNGQYFSVGSYGDGHIEIGPRALVSTTIAEIGRYRNATGTGAGTIRQSGTWNNAGNFMLGYEGTGDLTLDGTAALNIGGILYIGQALAGSGTLATAPGSTVTVAGNVEFGYGNDNASGTASVGHAQIGGLFTTGGWTRLGHRGAEVSSLTITGTYLNAANFFVGGQYGSGTFFLAPGARLDVGAQVYIGDRLSTGDGIPDAVGYATVAGVWTTTGNLSLASNSYGTLELTETGTLLTGGNSVLANAPGAVASATVAGRWHAGGSFYNGNAGGRSTLRVGATGTITTAGNYYSNDRSLLGVTLAPGRDTPHITAAFNATLAGTLEVDGFENISYAGVTKASQLAGAAQTILRAPAGVTGDFSRIVVRANGVVLENLGALHALGLPDYIAPAAYRAAAEGAIVETEYRAGLGLSWQSSQELAHGTFTIPAGATFEIDIPLADRPGAYTSGWDGKKLTKAGPGTLILSANGTRTGDTDILAGTLRLAAAPDLHLGALLNTGTLDLNNTQLNPDPAAARLFRTVTAASLSGAGAYRMTVDLAAGTSDKLVVLGDAAGHHRLLLTGAGPAPTGDEGVITLVTIGGMDDTAFTVGGELPDGTAFEGSFDYGVFNYAVVSEGNKVLIRSTGLDPSVHDTIRGIPGAQSILWNIQRDTLAHHLGELRSPRDDAPGARLTGLWGRGHASRASLDNDDAAIAATDMRPFDLDTTGFDVGADCAWRLENARATLGLYLSAASARQKFHPAGAGATASARSDSLGGGLYGSWLHDNGLFANLILSTSHYKNSFDAADGSANHTTATYRDHAFDADIETGWRLHLGAAGWFLEPTLSASRTLLDRGAYTLSNPGNTSGTDGLSVRGTDATITRYRGLLRAGRAWAFRKTGWLELSARAAAAREDSTGGEVFINQTRWRPNLDGNRLEAGLSLAWQPAPAFHIHLDYDYASADHYEKPWSLGIGLRCQF